MKTIKTLDHFPTGAELTAAADERRAKDLGLPPAPAYTPAEFGEFCRLNELTSTVELHKFMNKHGRAKCNAMRAALCPR